LGEGTETEKHPRRDGGLNLEERCGHEKWLEFMST
jgi:hypothetical protein